MPPMPGLSPRVRGNLGRNHRAQRLGGSIPACAGEPCGSSEGKEMPTVYPRVCGGTSIEYAGLIAKQGLSPRVRGNHNADAIALNWQRSIPACAGEP